MDRLDSKGAGVLPARLWLTLVAMLVTASLATLFITLMAVQAQADTHGPNTVTLCANPAGQLTVAPESGCPASTTALQVTTGDGLDAATAELEAADAALAARLATLETAVLTLETANTGLTNRVANLETANTALTTTVANLGTTVDALVASNTVLTGRLGQAEGWIDDLETRVSAIEGLPAPVDLSAQVAALQATLNGVSRLVVQGQDTLRFEGMNLQVVNGNGSTDGSPNGLGNLIIGYNRARTLESDKGGSHYLVVGDLHNYTQSGGIVAGLGNTASGNLASVTGGAGNEASGRLASISGGNGNIASGELASVTGGSNNTASNTASTVSGGNGNIASGERASVSGGTVNTASGLRASVSGGSQNTASGQGSSVSGGRINTASGFGASVSGGSQNSVEGGDGSVSGGILNRIHISNQGSISGGRGNTIEINANNSSILGGKDVSLTGEFKTWPTQP